MMDFTGMRVVVDPNALEETDERLFPVSRHRSKRVHKKLMKRFGSEFRKVPAAFRVGRDMIIVHPVMYEKLRQQLP